MICAKIFEIALRAAAWVVCLTNFDGMVDTAECSTDVVARRREVKLEAGRGTAQKWANGGKWGIRVEWYCLLTGIRAWLRL